MITRDRLIEILNETVYFDSHGGEIYGREESADLILKELQPGPFPNGDAEDPPVHQLALDTAKACLTLSKIAPHLRVTAMQIAIRDTIFNVLDRCEQLGGRSKR